MKYLLIILFLGLGACGDNVPYPYHTPTADCHDTALNDCPKK